MKTQLITIITIAILALAGPSLAGTTDRDYGVLPIPEDAPLGALMTWQACGDHQESARGALRFGCGDRAECRNYVSVPGHREGARRSVECFEALIKVLGGTPLQRQAHYAHNRLTWEERPAGSGQWVEVEGPYGYYVSWAQRTDGCQATIWGVLGPAKPGTPWYLDGAPSMRLPCPGAEAAP